MMITGRQIREARALVRIDRRTLAQKVGRITTLALKRAEDAEDEPTLAPEKAIAVQKALEKVGVEFTPDGPRLRQDQA